MKDDGLDKFIERISHLKRKLNTARNDLMDSRDFSESEATWEIINHEICNLYAMIEDIKKTVNKNERT